MGSNPDAAGPHNAHDAHMTNTTTSSNNEVRADRRRTSPRRPRRRWVGRAFAATALVGALGVATVGYGFGSSPGSHRVAISDGTSNT